MPVNFYFVAATLTNSDETQNAPFNGSKISPYQQP